MKVCQKQFPLGTLKDQKSDGFYMDKTYAANIDIFAKKIADDMQFVGVCSSSTFEVRTGKSTFMQQTGSYYTEKVNEYHNINLKFTEKNIVFKTKDLIERAMELPKYSILILDEGDDLTEHYASKVARELRKFFRKSGQLNLFIIIIMPDFFELGKNYAIGRSNFLIDVKFEGEFDRGYFEFYSFTQKKWLYIKGKKNHDWSVVNCSFRGRFPQYYMIDEELYRKIKYRDLVESEENKLSKSEEKFKRRSIILIKFLIKLGQTQQQIADELSTNGDEITRQAIQQIANANRNLP